VKQNITLRLTINVDPNEQGEFQFVRAMLRRLNVTHAKARPRSGLKELLGDGQLRDQLEVGRERTRKRKSNVVYLPQRSAIATEQPKALPAPEPSKKVEVEVKRFDPPKPKFRYIRLKEQRFEPPNLSAFEQVGGAT
jgi:hypothetical protein